MCCVNQQPLEDPVIESMKLYAMFPDGKLMSSDDGREWSEVKSTRSELWLNTNLTVGNKLLDTFNSYFEGAARATVNGNRLEITIASQTLVVSLPEIVGGQAKGSSQNP